jgi:hypothetical protein
MKKIETILKELNTKQPGIEYFVPAKGNLHTGKPAGEVPHHRKTEITAPKFTLPKKR